MVFFSLWLSNWPHVNSATDYRPTFNQNSMVATIKFSCYISIGPPKRAAKNYPKPFFLSNISVLNGVVIRMFFKIADYFIYERTASICILFLVLILWKNLFKFNWQNMYISIPFSKIGCRVLAHWNSRPIRNSTMFQIQVITICLMGFERWSKQRTDLSICNKQLVFLICRNFDYISLLLQGA